MRSLLEALGAPFHEALARQSVRQRKHETAIHFARLAALPFRIPRCHLNLLGCPRWPLFLGEVCISIFTFLLIFLIRSAFKSSFRIFH